MDNNHNSIGPVVGSSRGKKKSSFLPTFLEKNRSTKFSLACKKFQKTKTCLFNLFCLKKFRKHFQKPTILSFCAIVSILTLTTSVVKSRISKNPGRIRKNKNFQLTKISTAKKANSQRFEFEKKSD